MTALPRAPAAFAVIALALAAVGFGQSWIVSLSILNLCLVSAVMALALNMQWGYAGLLNFGATGFVALGGLAAVLVSAAPVPASWAAGGPGLLAALLVVAGTAAAAVALRRRMRPGRARALATTAVCAAGYFLARTFFDPATDAIERVDPSVTGYLGGAGLPIVLSWAVGGAFAAGAAWLIGKVALGLRADYFAVATLGISEIVLAVIKNEEWLARGVKNVTGLSRPVPREIDLQTAGWFLDLAARAGIEPETASILFVKLCYAGLFAAVLAVLVVLCERALDSPWGRTMRAIRDDEEAAEALGKDTTRRRLQIFVLGAAVAGLAGAMLTTLDGQLTPGSYNPLRFTFLIWVMVLVGGSGNNWGAVVGGFLVWFLWVEAEPAGFWLVETLTAGLAEDSATRAYLLKGAPHMRLVLMGLILIAVMRFNPQGLVPEARRRRS